MSDLSQFADDLTPADSGKYQPDERPVLGDGLKYEEVEARVFAALDADHRTLGQIKKHAGFRSGFDLSQVTDGMLAEQKLQKLSNGEITAYFRWEQTPTRFWLSGKGTTLAEYKAETPPDADKPKKNKSSGSRSKRLEANDLFQAASTLKNLHLIAKKLGWSHPGLSYKIMSDPVLKETYERARKQYRENHNHPDVTPEQFEELAAGGLSQVEAAERLGMSIFVFKNRLRKKRDGEKSEYRKAWDRGTAAIADSRTSNGEEKPAKPAAAKRAQTQPIEKAQNEPLPIKSAEPSPKPRSEPKPAPVEPSGQGSSEYEAISRASSRYVTFLNGSQFLIAFEGNLLTLNRRERDIIMSVTGMLDQYEEISARDA